MRHRLLVLSLTLLLATIGFAGCTDDGGDDGADDTRPTQTVQPPTPTGGGGSSRELVAGSRPIWFLGLQWTFEVESPEVDVDGDVTLVVAREAEDVWQVAPTADSDPEVVKWSLFWHLPPLGTVAKDSLAPHIHGALVTWFHFPLRDGKEWQGDDHHGTQVNYTASRTETTLFDGRTVPALEVVGERGGATWLRYVYTAEVAWFTEAEVDGDGDGVVDHRIKMKDAQAGAAHLETPTFEPKEVASLSDVGPGSIVEPATGYTVPEGAEELYVFFVLGGGPGRYTGSVTLPSGTVKSFNFTNSNQSVMAVVRGAMYPVTAGEGNVGSMILGEGFVFGEVFAVVRDEA